MSSPVRKTVSSRPSFVSSPPGHETLPPMPSPLVDFGERHEGHRWRQLTLRLV
jgi:hypothetical protein